MSIFDLPDPFPWRPGKFEPAYGQVRSPTWGRKTQVANIADDKWLMKYETRPLIEPAAEAFDAFLATLKGGVHQFRAYSPIRQRPYAYKNGFGGLTFSGSPFSGSGNLTAIGAQRDTVTVNALPNGFVLTAGDHLSFPFGASGQTLHRVLANAVATSGSVTLSIDPVVPFGATTGVAVLFQRAWCKGGIKVETIQRTWLLSRHCSFSFEAEQVD